MAELKPCPFCGGKPQLVEVKEQYKIFCSNPDCDCQYGWCADKGYIVKGWNRRGGSVQPEQFNPCTNYCRYKGVACEFATEYGYCKISGCVKRSDDRNV